MSIFPPERSNPPSESHPNELPGLTSCGPNDLRALTSCGHHISRRSVAFRWARPLGRRGQRRKASSFGLIRRRGGGQPERGEQQAAEDVGGVMLAPVQAGHGRSRPA